jgi:hypothetical protein
MQLLEIIGNGPNTFGIDKESGTNSVDDAKKSAKTPLPAHHPG